MQVLRPQKCGRAERGNMGAPILSVVQAKGGSGKTSAITMLALAALERGEKVAFLDGDQNNDGSAYLSRLNLPNLIIRQLEEQTEGDLIDEYSDKVDLILVDTSGGRSGLSMTMLSMSDMCIIPVARSKNDIKNALNTIKDIQNLGRRQPHILNAYRILWSNVASRYPSRPELKYMNLVTSNSIPCLTSQFRNRPIMELATSENIDPFDFVKNYEPYIEKIFGKEKTMSDAQKLKRTKDEQSKAIQLVKDINDIYDEILDELTRILNNPEAA